MKIRRIIAGFIAAAVAIPMAVIPSAAATIVITPSGSTKKYALEITAVAETADITFARGDVITMSTAGVENSAAGVITTGSSSTAINVKKVSNAKMNNASITSSAVSLGFQSGTNQLPAGTYKKFTWTGKLYFSDETLNPTDDLGIDLKNFSYNISFEIYTDNFKQTITFNDFSGKVSEESSDDTFKKDTAYGVRNYVNGGKGFTLVEQDAIRNGSNFKATITLKSAVSTSGVSYVGFYTDLFNKTPIYTMAGGGSKTVTLDIPKYYIYEESYGYLFQNIYLTGAAEFTSVIITYDEGSSTATTTTTTAKTDTSSPSAGDSAEDELYLNYSAVTLNTDASIFLKSSYSDVTWSTSNRDIVRVFTSGKITAVATGIATVTAKNANGDKVTCKVTVLNSSKPLTSYALNTTKGTVYVDSSYSISKAKVSRTDYTDKITWTTSDPSIATVNSSGKVTIVGVGKATITATTSSGLTSSCVLTAKNPSLSLASTSATVNVNGTVTIKATAKPSSSKITYESMNEKVASVDKNGVVKGLSKGTAKIEVTSSRGIVKVFTVTVN